MVWEGSIPLVREGEEIEEASQQEDGRGEARVLQGKQIGNSSPRVTEVATLNCSKAEASSIRLPSAQAVQE